jgi:hypothetical protein
MWGFRRMAACGGAGMPCPICNLSHADNRPRLPEGFQADENLDESLPLESHAAGVGLFVGQIELASVSERDPCITHSGII